jgi:hypothetical protein
MLLHASAAEDRPALEHFLVPILPPGIVGPERQPWIYHHGEVRVVLKANGDAGKVGIGAQLDFLNCPAPSLWELHQPRVARFGLLRGAAGLQWRIRARLLLHSSRLFSRPRDFPKNRAH